MQDGIIAGNGNSRYLKTVAAALSLYPDYESFMAALIAGTFPIDLNGINAEGWTQQGTPLNKANLFSDSTASVLGLTASNTPNDALAKLKALIDGANANANGRARIATGSYAGANPPSFGQTTKTITVGFETKAFIFGCAGLWGNNLSIFSPQSLTGYIANQIITATINSTGITLSGNSFAIDENVYTFYWVAIG